MHSEDIERPERSIFRSWPHSKVARCIAGVALTLEAIAGAVVAGDEGVSWADSTSVHHVKGTDGQGLWLHPNSATIHSPVTDLMTEGQAIDVQCFTVGESINGDNVWLLAVDEQTGHTGYAADYYIDTQDSMGSEVEQLSREGIPKCGDEGTSAQSSSPPPSVNITPCFFNMKAPSTHLTFSYVGEHRYYGNAWQAAQNWTNLNTGLTIEPSSGGYSYVQFKDISSKSEKWYAKTDIPETIDWEGPLRERPAHPHIPLFTIVEVNQYWMDKLDDFHRTYALTHEIGHALGLAHTDTFCGDSDASIMDAGSENFAGKTFNAPQYYDKIEIEELYGLTVG